MTQGLAERKNLARAAAFERRKGVHDPARMAQANGHLRGFLMEYADQPISGYMAIRTEIDPLTTMARHANTAPVGVPIVVAAGQALEFHLWSPQADMKTGPFGASVPVLTRIMVPRVVILPLAAFDRAGHRLGYGGGFYDRTLEGLRRRGSVLAVGFAYAGQQVDELPVEATDQPMDAVVTENGVLQFVR